MHRITAIALCCLILPAGAGEPRRGLPVVKPEQAGFSAAGLKKIDERMQEFVAARKTAGVVTLVARDGRIVHLSAVGHADIAAGRRMTDDTLFAIASMTKPITATAVMILVDEGKVSLDDQVSKYIPEFKDVKLKGAPPKRALTVRDLLTHTAGLGGSQQNAGSLENTAKEIAKRPLFFQPGERWQYSPGLTVCGRVVEVASGQSFDRFLTERIFKPLGMHDTTFFPNESQRKRIATLYQPGQGGKGIEATEHWLSRLSPKRTPNPSGGLFSTSRDLASFYQMILNGGELNGRRIVSREAVKQMTSRQTGELKTGFTPGNCWGLGWCIVRKPQGVSAMLSRGTFGHGGAFGTQGWVDPQRKLIFVLMIQRTRFGNSDGANIRGVFQKTAVDAIAGGKD